MDTLEKKVEDAGHVSLRDIRVMPIKTSAYKVEGSGEGRLDAYDMVGDYPANACEDCDCHCATY